MANWKMLRRIQTMIDQHRFLWVPALMATCSLASCGGGGGGGGATEPPATSLPLPPAVESKEIVVTTFPTSSGNCTETYLFVGEQGDFTAFWCETVNGVHRLMAGHSKADSSTMSAVVTVEQGFVAPATPPQSYTVTAIGSGRFLVNHKFQSLVGAFEAGRKVRVVDIAGASAPTVGGIVGLPDSASGWLQGATGGLYALLGSTVGLPASRTIDLGLGTTAQVVVPNLSLPPSLASSQFFDTPHIDPRALWVGEEALGGGQYAMRLASMRLDTGEQLGPDLNTLSAEPYTKGIWCGNDPAAQVAWFADGQAAIAWNAQDPFGTGYCEWFVNGRRVAAASGRPGRLALTGSVDGLLAAWFENIRGSGDALAQARLKWSRRDGTSLAWSTPAVVYPPFDRADIAHLDPGNAATIVAGPKGSLAAVWIVCRQLAADAPGTCMHLSKLVSKHVNGQWSTQSLPDSVQDIKVMAVNANGKGVLLTWSSTGLGITALRF